MEEAARVLAIGTDPADHGGEVDDDLRPAGLERAHHAVGGAEVEVGRAGNEDVVDALRLETTDDGATEESE